MTPNKPFHPTTALLRFGKNVREYGWAAADDRVALYDLQTKAESVPPKVRELIAELERAGFVNRGGKGNEESKK